MMPSIRTTRRKPGMAIKNNLNKKEDLSLHQVANIKLPTAH
jgi:hypothetical protein